MKLNKVLFTSVAALTMFSASTALIEAQNQTTVVEAKTTKKNLKHNAAVYNSKGKRVKKAKILKKGKAIKILGYKAIKGKKYARIGKNKYVKTSNFKKQVKKTNPSKKTKSTKNVKKTTSKKSSDPMINKYQAWLDERDDGVMVAIRDTRYSAMYNYGGNDTTIHKGEIIEIPEDDEEDGGASVFKAKDGQYYIEIAGPDDVVDYPAADFTFNAYKKTSEYKNLVKKYILDEDKYSGADVTLSGPAYGDNNDYKAGDKIKLDNNDEMDIILNEQGGYSLIGYDDADGEIEIPITSIASYKPIPVSDDDE